MNPFLAAVMRIAQNHYGGNMNTPQSSRWLAMMARHSQAANPVSQNVINQLGVNSPQDVMRMPYR